MTTELLQKIDKYSHILDVYDSTGGCTILIRTPGQSTGVKFNADTKAGIDDIIDALRISKVYK